MLPVHPDELDEPLAINSSATSACMKDEFKDEFSDALEEEDMVEGEMLTDVVDEDEEE